MGAQRRGATLMRFTLTINCDNAAFEESPHQEVAVILENAASRVRVSGDSGGTLFDTNGNAVGEFTFTTAGE